MYLLRKITFVVTSRWAKFRSELPAVAKRATTNLRQPAKKGREREKNKKREQRRREILLILLYKLRHSDHLWQWIIHFLAIVVSLAHGRPAELPEHTVVWAVWAIGAWCLHHTLNCLIPLPPGAAEAWLVVLEKTKALAQQDTLSSLWVRWYLDTSNL